MKFNVILSPAEEGGFDVTVPALDGFEPLHLYLSPRVYAACDLSMEEVVETLPSTHLLLSSGGFMATTRRIRVSCLWRG